MYSFTEVSLNGHQRQTEKLQKLKFTSSPTNPINTFILTTGFILGLSYFTQRIN